MTTAFARRRRSRVGGRAGLLLSLALVFVPLTAARAAHADPQEASPADALFRSAKDAMGRGDLATACTQFRESERLEPAPGTLLNLAECEERSGKLAVALAHVQEARNRLPAGDFRIAFAESKLADLTRRVPHLAVALRLPAADGAEVIVDRAPLAPAAFGAPLPVDPGRHVAVVRAPGHAETRQEIDVGEGEKRDLTLDVGPALPTKDVTVTTEPPRTQKVAGLVVGGVGVVGLAVGTFFGIASKTTYDDALSHCPTGPCDAEGARGGRTAHQQATASTVSFIAGGALLAVGATLYLTAPKAGRVSVQVGAPTGALGFAVGNAW